MTHETLSALLDGECSDQELDALLDALDREPEMKATWGRMQLARDVRGGAPVRQQVDICAAVMAGLGEAPDGLRPKVVELATRHKPRVSWRAAAGFAAAASVAAVAITLGVNFGSVHGDKSEEHTSELQSLMRISYAVFCLNKKKKQQLT